MRLIFSFLKNDRFYTYQTPFLYLIVKDLCIGQSVIAQWIYNMLTLPMFTKQGFQPSSHIEDLSICGYSMATAYIWVLHISCMEAIFV